MPKPKKTAPAEAWQTYRQQQRRQNLSTAAVQTIRQLRTDLDQRHGAAERVLVTGVDGSYTNQTVLKALPPRTTLIGRVRKDAKFCAPPRPEEQPRVGTRRQYGAALPTPEQLRQDESIPWPKWQTKSADQRLSTAELLRQLRNEVWAYALPRLQPDCEDFVTGPPPGTKSPESNRPVLSALLYATAG